MTHPPSFPPRSRFERSGWPGRAALLAVTLCLGVLSSPVTAQRPPVGAAASGGVESPTQARVIVRYRTGTVSTLSASGVSATLTAVKRAGPLGQRVGLTLTDGLTVAPRTQVIHAQGLSSSKLAARLAADPDVEYAVPDRRRRALAAPSDPLYAGGPTLSPASGQWYLHNASRTLVSSINAEAAWALTPGLPSVVVAVLDTGVRKNHPDLSGKLLAGYDFVSDKATANDGDARDGDPSDPGDWITEAENADSTGAFHECGAAASSWHGTQTAGLVGATTNNGVGMASIGRNVMVLPVRVLGKCGGYDSDIISGMRWAAGLPVSNVPANPNPAKVINLSLGAAERCLSSYQDAINEVRALGANVVASAGNDGLVTNMPANCSGVIAVGGLRHLGTKNGYSSLGGAVTLSAPAGNCVNATGECLYPILSTSDTGTTTPIGATYTTGGKDYTVGTSFSAPLVSGTIGLMLSAKSTLTPDQTTSILKSTTRAFPTSGADSTVTACVADAPDTQLECYCTVTTCGAGMLDAAGAVNAVLGTHPLAVIATSAKTVTVGQTLQLSAAGSSAPPGRTLTGYSWAVTSGASRLMVTSGAQTAEVTLLAHALGNAIVTLTVTDSSGASASSTQNIDIVPVTSSESDTETDGGGGGGGGGAWSPVTALLIGAAAAALALQRRRAGGPSR